jgi:hypothetical protein
MTLQAEVKALPWPPRGLPVSRPTVPAGNVTARGGSTRGLGAAMWGLRRR